MSNFVEKVRDCYLIKRIGGDDRLDLPHEWLREVFESIKLGKPRAFPKSDYDELRQIMGEVMSLKCKSKQDWDNLWAALLFMWCVPTVNVELQKLVSEIDETLCEHHHTRTTISSLKRAIAKLHPLP